MAAYIWVGIGGAIGSVLRLFIANLGGVNWGDNFPWSTLFINVTGSFAIGFLATFTGPEGRWIVTENTRLFFMTGICGGYTTFSAFSLQTLALAQRGHLLYAGSYIMASVILCLLAVWLGYIVATLAR